MTVEKTPIDAPPLLRQTAWALIALLLISALYCAIARLGFHLPYPYDWPLFYRDQNFTDFTIYRPKFQFFHQPAFYTHGYPFTYPSPMALLYEAFFELPGRWPLRVFLTLSVLSFLAPAVLFGRALEARGVARWNATAVAAAMLLTSWPAALLFDRANVEVFVWIALLVAVWAFATGREWLAAGLFGVAASLKLFPFVFLALFLSRRRFSKLLFGAAIFAAVTLISLVILGPSVSVASHGISDGLRYFHDEYVLIYNRDLTGLDHSLFGLVKVVVVMLKHKHYEGILERAAAIYMPAMAVVGAVLYFWRIRILPWLNQLILLSVASILFTPFSGDATLIHLYYSFVPCCFLSLAAYKQRVHVPALRAVLFCYAWLLAFESFEISSGRRLEAQGKCIVLVVLFYLVMRYPLGARLGSSEGPEEMAHPQADQIEGAVALP